MTPCLACASCSPLRLDGALSVPSSHYGRYQEKFTRFETQLKEIDGNDTKLKKQRGDLLELKEVLINAVGFFTEVSLRRFC